MRAYVQVERAWEHKGLLCVVVMHGEPGHRCGYVRVLEGHPLHGKHKRLIPIDVHGGVTFAQEDVSVLGMGWWIGFDTIHTSTDALVDPNLDPGSLSLDQLEHWNFLRRIGLLCEGKHYWKQDEVEAETMWLADKIAEWQKDVS